MICKRHHFHTVRFIHQVTVILILSLTLCILLGFGSLFVSGSKASANKNYKYYTSVEVKKGDTLWDIASEHMTEEYRSLHEYVAEVKALNGLRSNDIRSGQCLVVPYYSSELK